MGWYPLSISPEKKREADVRSGSVIPNRSERQKCWNTRDAYFACLDANNIVDAVKNDKAAREACGKANAEFERDCAAQWVTYFKQWRVQDMQKKARLKELEAQGAIKMDVNSSFKS